jgi:cytochrome c oxidase subunit 2
VIHSFWVPSFLFKMDVIPGKTNVFELTPDKLGTYAGKCAELCGVDHARMLFQVKVVERDEFDSKMAELRARGNTGVLDTDRITNDGQRPGERTL